MKKNSFIIIFLFSLFTNALLVNAGVCDNKEINAVSGYCDIGKSYSYIKNGTSFVNRAAKTANSDGYIGFAHDINASTTLSGHNEFGFCLDPGLSFPFDVTFSYGRELDVKNSDFDNMVYKVYQRYMNDIIAANNSKATSELLTYVDVALRTLTFKNGVAINNSITGAATNYQVYKEIIAPYIAGEIDTVNVDGKFDFKYFAEAKFLEDSKKWYLDTVNSGLLWSNPLKITSKFKNESNIYKFNFEVDFGDYFSSKYNYDNNNYGKAYFDYYLTLNGVKIDNEYSLVKDGTITATGPGYINNGEKYNFFVNIPSTVYNDIETKEGEVKIELHYKTYHPMSDSNVFINYLNKRTSSDLSEAKYQRMIVFSKVEDSNVIGYDSNVVEEGPFEVCKQENNKFYYMDSEVGFDIYLSKCDCPSTSDGLNDDNKKKFSEKCIPIERNEYSSNLPSCDVDESGSGHLTHIKTATLKKTVNGKNICDLKCDEVVEVTEMTNRYSVKAGKIFELDKYPKLTATKTCNVTVYYDNWKNEYINLLKEQINKYNAWSLAYETQLSKHTDNNYCTLQCTWPNSGCCGTTYTVHSGSYTSYFYNDSNNIITENTNTTYSCSTLYNICPHATSVEVASKKAAFDAVTSKIEEHINSLKFCHTYLNNMGSIDNYYNFISEMRFYYQQEYSKLGLLYNDERTNNIDDSLFKSTKEDSSDSGNYSSYNSLDLSTYKYLEEEDNEPNDALTNTLYSVPYLANYNINRTASYKYSFKPSVLKYGDGYTGIISSNSAILNNPISLGYVYDTDITAVSKTNNINYYEFTALGENNEIYKYFKNDSEKMKRYCEYEITNDIIKGCEEGNCSDSDEVSPKINLVYRMVDPLNIDPNNRLGDKGFKNWNNDKGKSIIASIEKDASTNSVFSPDNLEYSFELDSIKIKDIRDNVNAGEMYTDFKGYSCNSDGNECKGEFVYNYAKKDEYNQLIGNGRSSWKDWDKDESTGKCYIDSKEVPCS